MSKDLNITDQRLSLAQASRFVFDRDRFDGVSLDAAIWPKVVKSENRLAKLIEDRWPIYGVTTGFGDSCHRFVDPVGAETLQSNLIAYLLCGTGPHLPIEASRAMCLFRLKSLSRGFSGVSRDLLERMQLYLSKDWIPVVPREGSLGASGDLIPLAYLAQAIQGRGRLHVEGQIVETAKVLADAGVEPYVLRAKEGLALVNGTSAMAGLFLVNIRAAKQLLELASISSGWLCMALEGRVEAFEKLVNAQAGQHSGQTRMAERILSILKAESYSCKPVNQVPIRDANTKERVQDRYSLRCAPQILGPILETIEQAEKWLECEVNGTSDNPLIGDDGELGMGGNFYGGYLSQGMDYLKICLAHIADMLDRQLATLIDEKSNRGLPPNLANWPGLSPAEHYLHHGLKGLHQSMSAITSEIMSKAMPNGIFSRSSESHNQDKVSLGMSAAVSCHQMIEQVFTTQTIYLICLAQALDLKKTPLEGGLSRKLFDQIRAQVAFVAHDQPLDHGIEKLRVRLQQMHLEA